MHTQDTAQTWASAVNTVTIGATAAQGGTRGRTVAIGGAKCIPWLAYEGEVGHAPAIAIEIWDAGAEEWPAELTRHYEGVLNDPGAWAKRAAEFGTDLICLRLMGTHPDMANRGADDAVAAVKAVLRAVDLPLVVMGCGVDEKDNVVLPRCCQAAAGENCLFGNVRDKNYRTLVAACLADGHKLIAESPLDVNIAKQVNILAHDVGYPLENIVIYPTTGALGYGLEYAYSIMERGRLAGLGGDALLRQPVMADIGIEAWRAKEAYAPEETLPGLGPAERRGPLWETLTATNHLPAGAELLVLRHPQAVANVRRAIEELAGASSEQ
ncbi:MAG: acetyl-CoA decarbonylase/synthase complex subunit delta [Candidatus Sumerlaeota bacterium]|nr:acetyl-CoA decarbonylase/synthase complex subunit delta [Candidatus Sumerlaeota bacterium]